MKLFPARCRPCHAGREGEIWFVRVLPPPHQLCPRHIVFTTPYVIRDWPERAFIDYLERELARMTTRKPPRTNDLHGHPMKYGPNSNHQNEYVFCAYTSHRHEVIFLTGISRTSGKAFPMPRPIGSPTIGHLWRPGTLAVARRVASTPIGTIGDRSHSLVKG